MNFQRTLSKESSFLSLDRLQQLQLGCEISRNSTLGGTLGGFALHTTHGICGFTCAHAILHPEEMDILWKESIIHNGNWPGNHSRSIYQPTEDNKDDIAGELVEAIFNAASGTEIAFFTIARSREPQNGKFPKDNENKDTQYRYEEGICEHDFTKEDAYWKFGCASNATRGILVRSEIAWCRFNYGTGGLYLENMFTVSGEFARPGDSGALVFRDGDPLRMTCVGLVEGGNSGKTFTFVAPISPILDYLDTTGLFDFKLFRAFQIFDRQLKSRANQEMEMEF